MPPLIWDTKLNQAARGHSEDMAKQEYFSHYTPEGSGPSDRFKLAGYTIKTGSAENIFMCTLVKANWYWNGFLNYSEYFSESEIVELAVNGWMNSPGHKANILNNFLPYEGVGVGISADGKVYITEDFG
jgi:uncharacterized protein YkwD